MAEYGTLAYYAEYHARLLAQADSAAKAGVRVGFKLQPSNTEPCPVAAKSLGHTFTRRTLKPLPLAGCPRAPRCNCCYVPEVLGEKPFVPETEFEKAKTKRDYEAALAKLSPGARTATLTFVNATLRAFGLKPPR